MIKAGQCHICKETTAGLSLDPGELLLCAYCAEQLSEMEVHSDQCACGRCTP